MRHPIRWRERKTGLSVTIKTKNTAVIGHLPQGEITFLYVC
jgi:hypothetical protein